jgi:hypothetical protein
MLERSLSTLHGCTKVALSAEGKPALGKFALSNCRGVESDQSWCSPSACGKPGSKRFGGAEDRQPGVYWLVRCSN